MLSKLPFLSNFHICVCIPCLKQNKENARFCWNKIILFRCVHISGTYPDQLVGPLLALWDFSHMCFGALWKPLRFTVQVTEIQKIQKTRLPFFGLVCTVPNQFNWSPNTCNASNSGKITKVFEIRPFEQKVLVKTIVNLSFFWQAILAYFS